MQMNSYNLSKTRTVELGGQCVCVCVCRQSTRQGHWQFFTDDHQGVYEANSSPQVIHLHDHRWQHHSSEVEGHEGLHCPVHGPRSWVCEKMFVVLKSEKKVENSNVIKHSNANIRVTCLSNATALPWSQRNGIWDSFAYCLDLSVQRLAVLQAWLWISWGDKDTGPEGLLFRAVSVC